MDSGLPARVRVTIEVPRGGFVKRRADGGVDYVSPVPCPFDYGCVPTLMGGDGDPLDAIVLGPRRLLGETVDVAVRAVVRFLDAGQTDDKVVCSDEPVTATDRTRILLFFGMYAQAKRWTRRLRGRTGETRLLGWEWVG